MLVFNSLNMVINVTTKFHIKTVYFDISDDAVYQNPELATHVQLGSHINSPCSLYKGSLGSSFLLHYKNLKVLLNHNYALTGEGFHNFKSLFDLNCMYHLLMPPSFAQSGPPPDVGLSVSRIWHIMLAQEFGELKCIYLEGTQLCSQLQRKTIFLKFE